MDGMPSEEVESCRVCKVGNAKRCNGCRSVAYCGKACQRKDWQSGHKAECCQLAVRLVVARVADLHWSQYGFGSSFEVNTSTGMDPYPDPA